MYPKPVQLVEATQEDGGLLPALGVRLKRIPRKVAVSERVPAQG